LELVQQIRQRQAEAIFGIAGETQLPKSDVSRLFEWTGEFFAERKQEIVDVFQKRMSANDGRRGMRQMERFDRPDFLFLMLSRMNPETASLLIQPEDIGKLRGKLSKDAVAIIDAQENDSARQKLVCRWVMSAVDAQFNPSIADNELMDFYDLEMSIEEQQQVDALSPDKRRWAISQLYRGRRRAEGRAIGFPMGPPPDRQRPDRDGK
jgi:hypothetical protein